MEKSLAIISEPTSDSTPVLSAALSTYPGFVFMWGGGDLTLTCGNCNATLCKNIKEGQIKNVVLQCPHCKQYNQT